MNNKGFMMAEVIVVASIILITLAGLYVSYNKIFSIYNQRVNYYDVHTLYSLAYVRDASENKFNDEIVILGVALGESVYYIAKDNLTSFDNYDKVSQTFKDYLEYLSGSIDEDDISTDNILIMEKCPVVDGSVSLDNCKYAYLEVFE